MRVAMCSVTNVRTDKKIMIGVKKMSIMKIKTIIFVNVWKDTERRRSRVCMNIDFKNICSKPRLKSHHKQVKWRQVTNIQYLLFSDEYKWNMIVCYGKIRDWYDIRKQPITFFRRRQGDKSLIFWVPISFNNQTSLVFLYEKKISTNYQETL